MILAAVALAFAAPAPVKNADQLWEQGRPFLEPAGIGREMFHAVLLWTELQYVLGYCRPHITDSDYLYWREWWKSSALERSDVGRKLLLEGEEAFNDGLRARRAAQPTIELCQRTADDWFKDMKAAVSPIEKK